MTPRVQTVLRSLADRPVCRPPGLLESLHYGYSRRYGRFQENLVGAEEWHTLNQLAGDLDDDQYCEVLPGLEKHAWEAGSHGSVTLARMLWPALSPAAKGHFLAGVARFFLNDNYLLAEADEAVLPGFIVENLPHVRLDSQAAAEIAANALRARNHRVFEAVMGHCDFDPEANVERLHPSGEFEHFREPLSQHATRTVDVLLEAAVRLFRLDAVEALLKAGACPDLPCWSLERSYNEWWSLLSYSLCGGTSFTPPEARERMFELLLDHGADPRGLPCEGLNHPLMIALANGRWEVADRLLDLGADFSGGCERQPGDFEKSGRLIHAGHPHLRVRDDDLRWVEESITPLMTIRKPWEAPLFYQGNAQGGNHRTFLDCFLPEGRLEQLVHFEKRGLPIGLTPKLLIEIADQGSYAVLLHLLRKEPNVARIVFRIRRRNPEFGTSGMQAWLTRPQADGINDLPDFDPGESEPLVLPDGTRFYFHLDAVAPPHHRHGPVTGGCFWLEQHRAVHRRRRDRVVVRRIQRVWRMEKVPKVAYGIHDLLPIVKEVDGRFFLPGIRSGSFASQHFPPDWRPLVHAWLEGPRERAAKLFLQRITDQLATTPVLPRPVLSEEERTPYPEEFWSYLRRLPDGIIGVTEESCRDHPDMLDTYAVWAEHHKPPRDFTPDPRVAAWPLWPQVPVELRPFFEYDDLFGKPSVRSHGRNAYEKAMIHQAVMWNNAQFMKAVRKSEQGWIR